MPPAHTYEITAVQHGVYDKTLTASAIDQVTIDSRGADVRPMARVITDGTAEVFFTVDGSDPAVDGQASYVVPAGQTESDPLPVTGGMVKLISTGAVKYDVTVTVGGA